MCVSLALLMRAPGQKCKANHTKHKGKYARDILMIRVVVCQDLYWGPHLVMSGNYPI